MVHNIFADNTDSEGDKINIYNHADDGHWPLNSATIEIQIYLREK